MHAQYSYHTLKCYVSSKLMTLHLSFIFKNELPMQNTSEAKLIARKALARARAVSRDMDSILDPLFLSQ